METISKSKGKEKGLPVLNRNADCNFEGYDASAYPLHFLSRTKSSLNRILFRGLKLGHT